MSPNSTSMANISPLNVSIATQPKYTPSTSMTVAIGERRGRVGSQKTTKRLHSERMDLKDLSVESVESGKTSDSTIIPSSDSIPNAENVPLDGSNDENMYDSVGRCLGKIHKSCRILRMKNGIIVSKRCARCLDWFDISMFSLRKGKNYPPRYAEYCPVCQWERKILKNKSTVHYRKSQRDADGVLMWQCSLCKEFKYEQDYSKDSSRRTIRSVCKQCYNTTHKGR